LRAGASARRVLLSGVGAAAVHAFVLVVAINWHMPIDPGAIAQPTDAISIELAESAVTEQSVADDKSLSAAASAVSQKVGAEEDAAASKPEPENREKPDTPVETPEAKAESAPAEAAPPQEVQSVQDADVVLPAAAPDPKPAPVAEPTETPKPKAEPAQHKPQKTAEHKPAPNPAPPKESSNKTTPKGGAQASSQSNSKSRSGRVSAATGNSSDYAARVQARVASRRPSVGGKRATVSVSFGVTSSGGLAYVRLGRSSGVAAFDQAAVSAVRSAAPFPAPPPGARTTFSIPFYFR
jgi:protein TonB